MKITEDQYFGRYAEHKDTTAERRENARHLLAVVNMGLEMAEADGVSLTIDQDTGCYIGGDGNGGFRPTDSKVGALHSQHKEANAVDIADGKQERLLARWTLKNESRLIAIGILGVEDPRWTLGWVHWQRVMVPSGRWCFIPSRAAPMAALLPEQRKG